MNLLLDTHALLWFLLDEVSLSKRARELIIGANESVFVSPASLWEIAIKISLGKYALSRPFTEFWNEQLDKNNFKVIPVTVAHVGRVVNLPFHHRDPFDRLLIAQSLEEQIPIVSNDKWFDLYGVKRLW